MRIRAWTGAVALALAGWITGVAPVAAQIQSRTVFQQRAWEVQVVWFEDGSVFCVAQVSRPGETFSVWASTSGPVKLQFYSTGWDFGTGDTANLVVQIDRRAPWKLTNAELYLQSVLFNLPDNDTGTRFVLEVMRGNTLYLRDSRNRPVRQYTLAGSSASIQALIVCVDALRHRSNPFR
jgi:hypothetical protein